MVDLERRYLAIVERVRGYQMSEAARTAILAEIEAIYRRERVQQREADQRNSTSSR